MLRKKGFKKTFLYLLTFLVFAVPIAKATPSSTESIGVRPADDSVRVIGSLPYSNQWTFERPENFLYLTYDTFSLAASGINVGHFQSQYNSTNFNIYSIDFFSKLFGLGDPLGKSAMRKFSIWGRYRLGLGVNQGSVIDLNNVADLQAEKSSLLVLAGQLGINFSYDWSEWFQPYVGFNYKPYYFRNTSSMSSAEVEGSSAIYGPSLGVNFPVLFSHRGSLLAEIHQDLTAGGTNQIFASQLAADFGIGLVF